MESNYPLEDSGRTVNDSFTLGCKIYKTHHENIWLSEYDFNKEESLKTKNKLLMFYQKGNFLNTGYVTTEFMEHCSKEVITAIIDDFHTKSVSILYKPHNL